MHIISISASLTGQGTRHTHEATVNRGESDNYQHMGSSKSVYINK